MERRSRSRLGHAACLAPTGWDEAPAATASGSARTDDHNHDQAAAAPRAVDHPDRHEAFTPAQRAAVARAHQQAAMPELLEGRTTGPARWTHVPENLDRLAAFTREANARRSRPPVWTAMEGPILRGHCEQ
ncbi:hypothetical protein ACWD9K_37800 [Streptomyces sp. 900116325]